MSKLAILGSRGYPSSYGGFETLVRRLAPFLVTRGHDVTVFGRRGARLIAADPAGVHVRTTRGLEHKSLSTLSYGLTSIVEASRRGFDAALVLNVANGYFLPALRRAGTPTAVNVDGLEWMRAKWGAVARTVFRGGAAATARWADELVYDSRALGEIWRERFGRPGAFIPYGADVLEDVPVDRLEANGLPTEGYVLAVARLVPENNVELLLDGLELLSPRPPVVIVGDANYENPTSARLQRLSAGEDFHWLGHVDDPLLLDQLWAHAGVYWHGHSVGGTNPALLQALGAGAPTVALDTPFNREVVEADDQLVPPAAAAVAERIERVLSRPDIAASFRDHGRATIRERYTWAQCCSNYEELLERLAGRGNA